MDIVAIALGVLTFVALLATIKFLDWGMSASNLLGLVVSVLVFAYLVYALLRGERL